MKVTELTPDHVGRRISLTGRDWFVRGVLEGLDVYHDYVVDSTFENPEPEPVPIRKWVELTVSGWRHVVSDTWEINVGMLE